MIFALLGLIVASLLLSFQFEFNSSYSIATNPKKLLFNRSFNKLIFALKPGSYENKIAVKEEYESLCSNEPNRIDRLKELKLILDCFEALDGIEHDLQVFKNQENSSDESIRESAFRYQKEFMECKTQIENQLNKIM